MTVFDKIRPFTQDKKYICKTYGCQMNVRDTETLVGFLAKMGCQKTEDEKDADIIIFNTCCVRENAENRIFGNLGYAKNLKKSNKELKIVVCGCMTQQDAITEKIKNSWVDVVFGTFNLHKFPDLLLENYESGRQVVDIWRKQEENVAMPVQREWKFKASVNVMYGCDNFCTYCVVPHVRGRERSVAPQLVLDEVNEAVANGAKEVLLLGQNVNSYGKKANFDVDFAGLLEMVNNTGVRRVRFATSHPKDLGERLVCALRDLPNVCKHLHLPFQAGSDKILQKMKRQYTKRQYLDLVEKLRREIPDISITTDIIVGFPTETDEDFAHTLDVVREAQFDGAFTFNYSPRLNTAAADMDGQVSDEKKRERFDLLSELTDSIILKKNIAKEGKTFTTLCDKFDKKTGVVNARTDGNALVHFKGNEEDVGEFVNVRITEGKPYYLLGEKC